MLILQIWQFDWDPNVQSIPIHTILKNKRTRGFYLAPTQIPSCNGGSPSLGKKYCRKHKLKSTPDVKTSHVYFSENLTIDCVQILALFLKKDIFLKTQIQSEQTSSAVLFCTGPIFLCPAIGFVTFLPKARQRIDSLENR